MRAEVIYDGTTHSGDVSLWNGRAHSLCGKSFEPGKFKERWFRGSVSCRDCKDAKKAGKGR